MLRGTVSIFYWEFDVTLYFSFLFQVKQRPEHAEVSYYEADNDMLGSLFIFPFRSSGTIL